MSIKAIGGSITGRSVATEFAKYRARMDASAAVPALAGRSQPVTQIAATQFLLSNARKPGGPTAKQLPSGLAMMAISTADMLSGTLGNHYGAKLPGITLSAFRNAAAFPNAPAGARNRPS